MLTKDISLAEQIRQSIAGIKNRPAGYSLGPGSMDPSNMVCTVTVFPLDLAARAADEIERLRAALGSIARDELAEAWNADSAGGGPEGWQDDYWRVVNIARQAISHCAVEPPTQEKS